MWLFFLPLIPIVSVSRGLGYILTQSLAYFIAINLQMVMQKGRPILDLANLGYESCQYDFGLPSVQLVGTTAMLFQVAFDVGS